MFKKMDYDFLKLRYPSEVANIELQIKKSRSKFKDLDPSQFEWGFSWYIQVKSVNIRDYLKNPLHLNKPTPHVSIAAIKKTFKRFVPISIPTEIINECI